MEQRTHQVRSALEGRPVKTRDISQYMGLSERQVLRMAHDGTLPARKIGNQFYFDLRKVATICGMGEES